jgi:hypothetical protein
MNIIVKTSKKYSLLAAVSLITVALASQLLLQQVIGQQKQVGNTSASTPSYLSNPNASSSFVSILLSKGYVNGKIASFIATDASDSRVAASITNNTGFNVNVAPNLAMTPATALQQGYDFVNGIKTSGSPMGFQLGVASALPGEKGYSPLYQLNFVKWNANATPRLLKSVSEIITAEKNGELTIVKTGIIINSPVVMPRR